MRKKLDLIGYKFGMWSIINDAKSKGGRTFWVAKCECGEIKEVPTDALRKGRSKSCGCNTYHYFNDLTGRKIGELEILRRTENNISKPTMWLCKCSCGNEKEILGKDILSGHTKSCGCLRKKVTGNKSRTHGLSKTTLYNIHNSMKSRCNGNNKDYGGRGITVCDEWKSSYENFHAWAMTNGYKKGLTIERIDVNGNYEPSNCCWIPSNEQQKNRRTVIHIKYKNETKTMAEWARFFEANHSTIQYHLKNGTVNDFFDKRSITLND